MIISLLVAADENNLIGKDNKLPWHLPADLKYFKNVTWGMPVVMGRKTFESMGKILPGRRSIVITRNKDLLYQNAAVVHTIDEAIAVAKESDVTEIFIIGGAEIFAASLPLANRIYLTRIHHTFEGDVYFPTINLEEWKIIKNIHCKADDKNKYDYSFQIWERT